MYVYTCVHTWRLEVGIESLGAGVFLEYLACYTGSGIWGPHNHTELLIPVLSLPDPPAKLF